MADIQHKDLTGAQLHEPKGADAANSGESYVADGAGSGSWKPVQIAQAACLRASTTGDTTLVSTAFQVMNNATLGGTLTWAENVAVGITTNTTGGYFTIPETGMYHVTYNCSFEPATNNSVVTFTLGKDSGAGVVDLSANVSVVIKAASNTSTYSVSMSCLPSLTTADKLYVMVKEASGNELDVLSSNFVIVRVS